MEVNCYFLYPTPSNCDPVTWQKRGKVDNGCPCGQQLTVPKLLCCGGILGHCPVSTQHHAINKAAKWPSKAILRLSDPRYKKCHNLRCGITC